MVSIDFTTLPSTGSLQYSGSAVSAGDDIAIANLGGVTYVPVANANGAVTFTFKVFDGDALSDAGTFTMTYSAVNDAPVNTITGASLSVNEDVALAITGNSIADVDDTSMTSVKVTADRGTFTLATSDATYDVGTQGTAASTVTISGTVANINTAIATITWTSASNDLSLIHI